METGQSFKCLFWAVIYCILYLVSASYDDLVDFDFNDLKDMELSYDDEIDGATINQMALDNDEKLQNNEIPLNEYSLEKHVHPFDWREKILRTAISKALTNVALRQKFVEVMPILRVLSAQQRLALSALISAQINAKPGSELKLDQVRHLFGDDNKKMMLPLVYDIANLVRNSARKYISFDYDVVVPVEESSQTPISRRTLELTPSEELAQTLISRRTLELTPSEDSAQIPISRRTLELSPLEESVQTPISRRTLELTSSEELDEKDTEFANTPAESSIEEFFADMPADVLDAKSINEALLQEAGGISNTRKRSKRAASTFVHKLIRSVPLPVNKDDFQKTELEKSMQLNTSSFVNPQHAMTATVPTKESKSPLTYQQIEDLAFANLNGTELNLQSADGKEASGQEQLPSPEELIAGPRYRLTGNKLRIIGTKVAAKRKRVQIRPQVPTATPKKCERFTASMCILAEDYPLEQIMGSIRRHKNAMSALLAEYHDKAAELEYQEHMEEIQMNKKRRDDENEVSPGGMCTSVVRYARPQKARSASGEWKYIVNTGQHTQTLRLEKCSNPQESCSYLSHNYRSRCTQVYNYHRLLSWDKARGLHVDIFKVPTCCSCHIDGYRERFPPLGGNTKIKDYTPAFNHEIYSTINDELDYQDEEDEDDAISYQYDNGYKQNNKKDHAYEPNELLQGSSNIKTKVNLPIPTVDTYLSPPAGDDTQYVYKTSRPTSGNSLGRTRRPYKSSSYSSAIGNEARADLAISGSEAIADKEVNIYGTNNDKSRVRPNRKRIYSVPTVDSAFAASASAPGKAAGTLATSPAHFPAGKTRRFPAASSSSPTESSEVGGSSHTFHHQHHVNSIYSTKYSNKAKPTTTTDSSKRINYSYHPIIDFFENNQKQSKQSELQSYKQKGPKANPVGVSLPPASMVHTEMLNGKNLRLRYGVKGGGVSGVSNGSTGDGGSSDAVHEESWHPMVANS